MIKKNLAKTFLLFTLVMSTMIVNTMAAEATMADYAAARFAYFVQPAQYRIAIDFKNVAAVVFDQSTMKTIMYLNNGKEIQIGTGNGQNAEALYHDYLQFLRVNPKFISVP